MDDLASRVANVFATAIDECIADRGKCSIALSRPTPTEVFRAVNDVRLPHRKVDVFQVDERVAKTGTDDRNLTLIERDLAQFLERVHLHEMPVEKVTPPRAVARYEKELIEAAGSPPALDLVHLGLGEDGHTASLLPDADVLDVTDEWVSFVRPRSTLPRMTLTYPTLNAARLVVIVVSGEEKAEALRGVLNGDRSMPAARLENGNVRFLVDAAAASRL